MNTKDYFIALLNAYLQGETAVLAENADYTLLYKLSHAHNLSAVVFSVLNTAENKAVVPQDAFRLFENDFFAAVMRYDRQGAALDALDGLLSENGIRHVFFKGAILRDCYPIPQTRVMGDIDVLIDEKDRDTVKVLLTENGYSLLHDNGPVYDYSLDGVKIEMHTKIISGKVGSSDAENGFADAMEHAVYDGCRGTLESDYHFAYLLAHLAHHFWFYGAGVKLLLDLAVFQKTQAVSEAQVLAKLKEIGLEQFAKVMLTLCRRWFGIGTDYGCDTEKTAQFLINYGAFGNANRNNAAVIARKQLEEGNSVSSLPSRWRLLFPSYQTVKSIPYIRFIEGRPYLLPLAWVYRLGYNLRHRREFVKATARGLGSDETKSDAQKELAYFEEIGLL